MKKQIVISILILLAMTGCGGDKQTAEEIITVDVTASYPEKELVLQEFMDVEYVPLETTDEFVTQGVVEAVGKDVLVVRNWRDGDIFIFDRATGKGIRKISRFGQGAEEYTQIVGIVLDEENNELFVKDYMARKVMVYDLSGNFKRNFKFADDSYYTEISNYDRDHLICFKGYMPGVETEKSSHVLVSKKDGSITREIQIPFKEVETPVVMKDEIVVTPGFNLISLKQNGWVLTRTSSDTIYTYHPDGRIAPLIIRTPFIHEMEVKVFLFPCVLTDRYCFMRSLRKELDLKTMKGFASTDLVYDKQEKALYQSTVYNDDYLDKKQVSLEANPVNHEIAAIRSLGAAELVEARDKGQLKGKLKKVVANLDEESNPVVMLIKYKE